MKEARGGGGQMTQHNLSFCYRLCHIQRPCLTSYFLCSWRIANLQTMTLSAHHRAFYALSFITTWEARLAWCGTQLQWRRYGRLPRRNTPVPSLMQAGIYATFLCIRPLCCIVAFRLMLIPMVVFPLISPSCLHLSRRRMHMLAL